MDFFLARQVLLRTASRYQSEQQKFSREEILKKINEIKYLSAQKKVPKLTLRKEIIHLQNKLEGIAQVEESILRQKKQESVKIKALKKENEKLRKQVALSGDKNIQKKVDKLSHLLGECLAKTDLKQDVALHKKIVEEANSVMNDSEDKVSKIKNQVSRIKALLEKQKANPKAQILLQRVSMIEQYLDNISSSSQDKEKEQRVAQVQEKLMQKSQEPEIVVEKPEVKHRLLLHGQKLSEEVNAISQEAEKELPLPPPPRME